MTAATAHVVIEKTRQIANLAQQGNFNLAVAGLVEAYKADPKIYDAIVERLPDYLYKSDLDDLVATVDMVK